MFPAWMTPPAPGHSQADAGALVYYYNCMACHGDHGQGLTTEWRAQWDVEHQNCSKSGCHGARHDPEGFTFPKNFAPAIVGAETLLKYETAENLYEFVSQKMPYQAPSALSEEEYWQLVAFLLEQRGVKVSHVGENNAKSIMLHPTPAPNDSMLLWVGGGVILGVTLVTSGVIVFWRTRKRLK
jgi:mono/diheme cytochrome c family protein